MRRVRKSEEVGGGRWEARVGVAAVTEAVTEEAPQQWPASNPRSFCHHAVASLMQID